MFGTNSTSTWGNPQQNQQQQPQQQTNAFGQPSPFGQTGAFGQPQQQQANPMFGGLGGTPAAPSGNTGFGAFGNTNPSQGSTTNPLFGGAKPATGFGAFGGTSGGSTFGGGGAFGQTNTTTPATGTSTGIFGQAAQPSTTGAFGGTSTGLFANKPATTFGAAPANSSADANPVVTTGTSNPQYQATAEKDGNINLQYQAISCMREYRGYSFEELRCQDYVQGRKTAGSGFGQTGTFGGTQSTGTGLFNAQPAQQNPTPLFGGNTTGQPTTTTFGAFGQPTNNQPAAAPAPTGLFGGSAFGTQQQQQQQPSTQSAFGTFGQPQQQQQQQQPASGLFGGGFGNTATKPAFTNFGGTGGGFGTFGQNQQQPQQQPATGAFGQPAPITQPAATGGFGTFGNNTNTANKSIFGQPATTQPATNAFGIFGNQQQTQQGQQQTAPPTNSIFGGGGGSGPFGSNNNTTQPQQQSQPNSLFGTTPAQPTTGLFGGGLFNNNNQQQQQQQQQAASQPGAFGLFGPKPAAPAAPSLFPSLGQPQPQPTTNAPQQSLFGNSLGQTTNQQPSFGNGLFGTKPAAPAISTSTSNGQGGNLFGTSLTTTLNAPGAQGQLTASISQPIGPDIFSLLPPGPRVVNLEQSQAKKKAGFFVDTPMRSPVPRVQLGYTPANSKLRGFGSSTLSSSAAGGNPFASLSFSPGKSNALVLNRSIDNRNPTGPDSFLRSSSPSLGSGGRHSVKKLILDKKVEPSDLFNKSGGSPGLRHGGKVTFSPALSVAAREKEAAAAAAPPQNRPAESPRPQRSPNKFTAQSTQNVLQSGVPDQTDSSNLEEGDYWVKPDLVTLKKAGYDQLSSFKDLVVGRVGYGEIHFLEPVDLTGLSKLGALLGEVVRFDDKECSVYPDSEEVDKPPPGSGLNVQARLSLVRCWAVDKATRDPVKDAKHPIAIKHLKRLKNMKDTHFEGFDITDGKWTFTVDHF